MPVAQGGFVFQIIFGILADDFVQVEAPVGGTPQQRFGFQARQDASPRPDNGLSRREAESTLKEGQAAQGGLLACGEPPPRVFKDRPQAAVTFWRVAQGGREKVEAALDFRRDFGARKQVDPRRGEFDGERHAVHALTNADGGFAFRAAQLLDAGAAGLNIEDSWQDGASLRPIAEQARRIEAIRSAAEKRNIPLVINARADSFLADGFATGQERIEDAVRRANAYLQAGADCIYPIGCAEQETLVILRQRIPAPINVLFSAKTPSLNALQEIGIKRVSFGPYIFRALLAKMSALFDEIQRGEGAAFMEHPWRGADVQPYLQSGKEPSA